MLLQYSDHHSSPYICFLMQNYIIYFLKSAKNIFLNWDFSYSVAKSLTRQKEDLEATGSQWMYDQAVDQVDQPEAVSYTKSSSVKCTNVSAEEGKVQDVAKVIYFNSSLPTTLGPNSNTSQIEHWLHMIPTFSASYITIKKKQFYSRVWLRFLSPQDCFTFSFLYLIRVQGPFNKGDLAKSSTQYSRTQ